MGISNIYAITGDYSVDGTNYAKLFTMKKKFLGNISWHRNQILFKIIHAGNTNGYFSKTYFLGVYETDSSVTTKFQIVEDMATTAITCVYVEDDTTITVYAKGGVSGANIRVQILYTPNIGFIDFYNYEKFSNTLSGLTIVNPTIMGSNLPTFSSTWAVKSNTFNRVKSQGSIVVVNLCLEPNGASLSDGSIIATLPSGTKPSDWIYGDCLYKKSDGTFASGKIALDPTAGYIKIYGIASGSTEIYINITFTV